MPASSVLGSETCAERPSVLHDADWDLSLHVTNPCYLNNVIYLKHFGGIWILLLNAGFQIQIIVATFVFFSF